MQKQDSGTGSAQSPPGSRQNSGSYTRPPRSKPPCETRDAFVKMRLKNYDQLKRPSARNRDIFHEVRIKGRSLRAVAAEFNLSHTQIGRIVKAFDKWLGETLGRAGMGDWMQRRGVIEYEHRERLRYISGQCLEEYEKSGDILTTLKGVKVKGELVREECTKRQVHRNWRWMDLALKTEDRRLKFEVETGQ